MAQARYPSDIAKRIFDLLDAPANKLALLGAYGAVFYGDQDKLPQTPAVCIEAGTSSRALQGAPDTVLVDHECYILVYHSKVQSVELNKRESEAYAEAIVAFLDPNIQLRNTSNADPIVIHGFCTGIDPGYSFKEGTLYSAVRITWNGKSKYRLGA